jgi:acetate kinase
MQLILETLSQGHAGGIHDVRDIRAVGHRVVHGGEQFRGSARITDQVIQTIEQNADLAPLHNPPNLTGIRAAMAELPQAEQVACFDTAFHATIPETAYLYALPHELYERYRIRRYGFHGTSHFYVATRAAAMLGRDRQQTNCITCHLGNGCSITAVQHGCSIDTSMGLTPLEGLIMGTRSGDIDPAIAFYLADHGFDLDTMNNLLNKRSGLLGVSGQSNDMRTLTEQAAAGNHRAKLAIDMFCYRLKKYIGAYCAVLGELHALVFTGGIGENAATVRAQTCHGLQPLGIHLDPVRNEDQATGERDVSAPESRVRVFVIPTDEEGVIAEETYRLVTNDFKE